MPRRDVVTLRTKECQTALATAIWSSLIVIAVVLTSRKLAGALTEQLSATVACLATTLAMGLSLFANCLLHSVRRPDSPTHAQIAAGVVTLVPPFALGIALLPGRFPMAVSYLVTLFVFASASMLVIGESSIFRSSATRARDDRLRIEIGAVEAVSTSPKTDNSLSGERSLSAKVESAIAGQDDVSQWMTRRISPDGRECLEGAVKIQFSPGMKQTAIHVPFVPPLHQQPQVTCEVLGNSPVRLRVTSVQPYGTRIEARRTSEAAQWVEVRFSAVATATTQSDAA